MAKIKSYPASEQEVTENDSHSEVEPRVNVDSISPEEYPHNSVNEVVDELWDELHLKSPDLEKKIVLGDPNALILD
jgi:hypothetical protein